MHFTTGCSTLLTICAAPALHALQVANPLWSVCCQHFWHLREAKYCAAPAADSSFQMIRLGHNGCGTEGELTEQQAACKKVNAALLASWHWHPIPSCRQVPAAAESTALLQVLCRDASSPLQIPLAPAAPGLLGGAADVSWLPEMAL